MYNHFDIWSELELESQQWSQGRSPSATPGRPYDEMIAGGIVWVGTPENDGADRGDPEDLRGVGKGGDHRQPRAGSSTGRRSRRKSCSPTWLRGFLLGNASPLEECASDEVLAKAGYGFYASGIMESLAATAVIPHFQPAAARSAKTAGVGGGSR
jgi:hypothetical protein